MAVIVAVTGFSWGFIIVKAVRLPPPVLAFYRLSLGAAFLWLLTWILRAPWPAAQRREMIGAGLAFGAHQLVFIAATHWTTVATVTVLAATMPLLVLIVTFREHSRRAVHALVLCAALALAGVVLVMHAGLGAAGRTWLGDLLAVVNVLAFGVYFLLTQRARRRGAHTVSFTAGVFSISWLVVLPALLLPGRKLATGAEIGLLAVLALGPGNGHLLLNWAHARVSAALSSLVLALIPTLASLWAFVVFGEPFTWRHGLGMVLVGVAITLGQRVTRRG